MSLHHWMSSHSLITGLNQISISSAFTRCNVCRLQSQERPKAWLEIVAVCHGVFSLMFYIMMSNKIWTTEVTELKKVWKNKGTNLIKKDLYTLKSLKKTGKTLHRLNYICSTVQKSFFISIFCVHSVFFLQFQVYSVDFNSVSAEICRDFFPAFVNIFKFQS